MSDSRLEALLAEAKPPPVPAGLADRVAAAATRLPQEAGLTAQRAAGRDRRGAWLRRPLIGGAIALGLAFSGAVAATLAGVPLPAKVAAVIAQIPFVGHKSPEPEHAPVRHAAAWPALRPAPAAPAAETASVDPAPRPFAAQPRPAALRRMMMAQRIVARRAAMGLPSPPVERVERMIHRRQMMRRWQMATPEQRAQFAATHPRAAAMIEAREARGGPAPGQGEAFAGAGPQAEARRAQREAFRNATPEQRQAYLSAHPRFRAMIEAREARGGPASDQGGASTATSPQAQARQARREAFRNATPEQRQAFLAAHPRFRAMLEARRARRQAMMADQPEAPPQRP
jgi:hypothetical protein